jgi:hypothetical protein
MMSQRKQRVRVETKTALLPSAGYNGKKWTRHTYEYSETITITPKRGKPEPQTGVGHFFRCVETGEIRMWGFDRTKDAEPEGDDVGTN